MVDGQSFGDHAVSAVVPCFNEEECVEAAHKRISAALGCFGAHEIIFVDDGSTDRTLELIRCLAEDDPNVEYLSFSRNFGLEAAFSAGFRYCRYPWLAQFDADLQSPPEEVVKLFDKALSGYDAVFAERKGRQDPLHRRLASKLLHGLARRVLGIELPSNASVFRVVRTSVAHKAVDVDLAMPYFLATLPRLGATYTTVQTDHHPRSAGRSKWSLTRLTGHALELFVGHSTRPLHLVLGGAVAVAAVCTLVVVSPLPGPGTQLRFLAVAQLAAVLSLGIVGAYLIRLLRGQSRNLPRYLIREASLTVDHRDLLYEHERAWAAPLAPGGMA